MAFMDAEEDGGISDEGKDKGLMERPGLLHQVRKEFEPRMNTDQHGSNELEFRPQLWY